MSVKVMGGVWELDLPQPEKMTMLALADHADHDGGNIFPSVELVAWKCGCSTRTVQRHIRKLTELGILELVAEARGNRPREYRAHIARGDRLTPLPGRGDTDGARGDTAMSRRGDTAMSPEPSVTVKEPPVLRLESEQQAPPPASKADFQELWDMCRRGSKKKAWDYYRQAVPHQVGHQELMEQRRRHIAAARERQFIQHLERWIRDERWEEDLPEPKQEEPANPFLQGDAHREAQARLDAEIAAADAAAGVTT